MRGNGGPVPPDALLCTLDAWTRQLTRTAVVEVAMVWPLTGDQPQLPGRHAVIVGSPRQVRLTPRDVFSPALAAGADSVAIAHTHLSDSGPSADDHAVTRRLVAAGAVLGIPLVAHLLVEPTRTLELLGDRLLLNVESAAA